LIAQKSTDSVDGFCRSEPSAVFAEDGFPSFDLIAIEKRHLLKNLVLGI
jgi:hypothetical protein